MPEAIAYMKQLMDLGCGWSAAVQDTVVAFEVDQYSLQAAYQEIYP